MGMRAMKAEHSWINISSGQSPPLQSVPIRIRHRILLHPGSTFPASQHHPHPSAAIRQHHPLGRPAHKLLAPCSHTNE